MMPLIRSSRTTSNSRGNNSSIHNRGIITRLITSTIKGDFSSNSICNSSIILVIREKEGESDFIVNLNISF